MAPNNAFSWHLCGAYKTFTMANMAAQRDHLNRVTWEPLEAQVLHWGVELGPIYVVTGPIWTRFPEEEFEIFVLGQVDRALMAQPDEALRPGVSPHIVRPTGFFTVVYRPASEDEDEQAVAFLMPHTHQRGLSFWSFIATVAVVEQASELEFGFDEDLKRGGRQQFWLDRRMPRGWSVRATESECTDGYRADGWLPDPPAAAWRSASA
jgi:DNA/RNA endonuclease G (NUC1)